MQVADRGESYQNVPNVVEWQVVGVVYAYPGLKSLSKNTLLMANGEKAPAEE
jgi:hypothetical protein